MTLGPLTFLAPLALLGLLSLPLIWWLLRITPPKPIQQIFPPLRILKEVETEEETPNSTPLWLLLFRLIMVGLIAIALAQPFLTRPEGIETRPVVLVVDNGWDAAGNWPKITKEAENRIADARRKEVKVLLLTTDSDLAEAGFEDPSDALRKIKSLSPKPAPNRPADLAKKLTELEFSDADVYWLSSGIQTEAQQDLVNAMSKGHSLNVLSPASAVLPLAPGELEEIADGLRTQWHRPDSNGLRSTDVTAHGKDGRIISRATITFSPGQTSAEAVMKLPTELRSQIAAFRATDSVTAGSTRLLDDSWGRPLIGVLTENQDVSNPLLSEPFYAETALKPHADVFRGTLEDILPLAPSVIVMPDASRSDSKEVREFVENGGLLIRFAGPKLAQKSDDFIPVRLRSGGRALGGALTWEEPQNFSEFAPESPFFGLEIPGDIQVKQQVMAEPGAETDSRTWARLEDGSPVVTSKEVGFGRIILFHVTAHPEWSNIPVSGLYVDMLNRLLSLAKASSAANAQSSSSGDWAPERVLNGYGRLMTPGIFTKPIPFDGFETVEISKTHPPGLYRQGPRRQALNIITDTAKFQGLGEIKGANRMTYGATTENNLGGTLLWLGLLMLAFDAILAIYASGRMRGLRSRLRLSPKATATVLLTGFFLALSTNPANAQQDDHFADALDLRLAYVLTGDFSVDNTSENAMEGLAKVLNDRTTIEPVGVRGVDPASDPLIFYPFLYWPVDRDAPALNDDAIKALNDYMAGGGSIVFDTRDSGDDFLSVGQPHPGLKRITDSLEIPSLNEVPEDHVLNKSYYLIDLYPGRWANGRVWVDRNQTGAARDGVSSVIIGGNDWAAAWAFEADNYYLEIERDIPKQREMALRFGVNLVMYTLAGNYKADQVHAKALIERRSIRDRQPQNLDDEDDGDSKDDSEETGDDE